MSNKSAKPLRLRPEPCRGLYLFLIAVHLLALGALCLPLTLPEWVRVLLALLVLAGLALRMANRRGRSGAGGVREIQWRGPGQWYVVEGNSDPQAVALAPDSFFSPWLVVMRLRLANGRHRVLILCRGSCPAADLRRLRVALRYGAFTADSEAVSTRW